MAKSPIERYDAWGIVFLVAIIIGTALLPFFKIPFLGALGISLLIFGIGGIIVARRKVSALKRTNPELFKALEAENSASATKCAVCGAELTFSFRCYYCKKHFCQEHKLPEKHHCSMAPTVSFRTTLLIGTLLILIGIAMLYVSLMPRLSWVLALGGFLIFMGTILLIARAWEESQSRRAMRLY